MCFKSQSSWHLHIHEQTVYRNISKTLSKGTRRFVQYTMQLQNSVDMVHTPDVSLFGIPFKLFTESLNRSSILILNFPSPFEELLVLLQEGEFGIHPELKTSQLIGEVFAYV